MKILIVDDSKAMRMIVQRTLKKTNLGDFTCVQAQNGVEALQVIQDENPDLVIADWNMPEMNGLELLQKLGENGTSIRFGFVTSETTDETRKQAKAAGAEFFVTKPFTPDSLQEALSPVLA